MYRGKAFRVTPTPRNQRVTQLDTGLLACSILRGADSATLNFIPLYPSIAATLGKRLGILENNWIDWKVWKFTIDFGDVSIFVKNLLKQPWQEKP